MSLPHPSRVADRWSKTACIVAVGVWGGSRCLLKNRDRNYTPVVKVYHEIREGVEVLYMRDEGTGWVEGLNEFGIGVVNAALSVQRDENEKRIVKEVGKKSKDGARILKALEQRTLDEAVEVACEYKGGIKGHTFISDPKTSRSVEQTKTHECVVKTVAASKIHVRTNHGFAYEDAGYTDGDDYVSSVYRRDRAKKVLRSVSRPEDIGPTLYRQHKGEGESNSMVRKTENMRTSTQLVLDLTKKVARLYLLPGEVDFEGVENKLPEGYSPKIKLKVYEYDDPDDIRDSEALPVKLGSSGELLPIMEPQFNLRELCKQLILLEDHLTHPGKRCLDCIRKHLLWSEALAEETVALDTDGTFRGVTDGLADKLRDAWRLVQDVGEEENHTYQDISNGIRSIRKGLVGVCHSIRVAELLDDLPGATDAPHGPVCPHRVVKRADYFNIGDEVLYGKYKNKRGRIVGYGRTDKGNPYVEVEPIPKGRKQNKQIQLYRIWHADIEKRGSRRTARKITLDDKAIGEFRKDFLMIQRNLGRIQDMETAEEFYRAVRKWGSRFEDFGAQIRSDLNDRKRDRDITDEAKKWAVYYLENMKPFWDFNWEFGLNVPSIPDVKWDDPEDIKQRWRENPNLDYSESQLDEEVQKWFDRGFAKTKEQAEAEALAKWKEEARKWDARAKRKSRDAWKFLQEVAEWAAREGWYGGHDPIVVKDRTVENVELAGFQTEFIGYDEASEYMHNHLGTLRHGLENYRKQASKVLPWLIQHQLPLVIRWDVTSGTGREEAASYHGRTIEVLPWGLLANTPSEMVRILAHEMSHHLYQTGITSKARDFWETVIRGDYTDLDLRDVLKSDGKMFDRAWEAAHPILALQWKSMLEAPAYRRLDLITTERIQEYLDGGGDPMVRVPAHPISWYAGKNPQEAFCEAVAHVVAYGPRAIPEIARGWLRTILPGIKISSLVERVAAKYKNKKEVPKADGDGTTTVYEYSDRQVQHRNREKAKRVEKLRKSIDELRRKVKGDLDSNDPSTRYTALAIALIDNTYERVGNPKSAEEGHFGVTGWKVEHITFPNGKARLKYVGKSGVDQVKDVTDAKLVKALKAAVKGKAKDEVILCEGDECRITSKEVNAYLEPFGVTAKDLRGLHANEEMRANLKKVRKGKLPEDKKEREKQLKDEFKEALEAAAQAVGHEASTLKSQYLVPGMEDAYLKDGTILDSLGKAAGGMPRVQYHATSWDRVAAILRSGMRLPKSGEGRTFVHDIPTISTTDKPENAWPWYGPALLELQVRSGAKYLERSNRQVRRGESLLDAVNRWTREAIEAGAAGFHMRDWQNTVGNQTLDPKVLEVVRVVNAGDAPAGILRTASYTDGCPVCGEGYTMQCRCHISERECPNGHRWATCPVHGTVVVLDSGVNTHALSDPCLCEHGVPRVATKSDAEREEEEDRRLLRKDPKKKPPRHDLRRRRTEDTSEGDDPDEEQDEKDRSRNWKDVGASSVIRVAYRYLVGKGTSMSVPKKVQQGGAGTYPTSTGANIWAKNPDGNVELFSSNEADKAKAYSEGKDVKPGGAPSEKTPRGGEEAPAEEKPKEKTEEEKAQEAAQKKEKEEFDADVAEATAAVEAILGDDDYPAEFVTSLENRMAGMSPEERKEFAKSFSSTLDEFKKNPPSPGKETLTMAREAIGADIDEMVEVDVDGKKVEKPKYDPKDTGKLMAQAFYADRVVYNPFVVAGRPLSADEKPASEKEMKEQEAARKQAAVAAYKQYAHYSKDERQDIANRLFKGPPPRDFLDHDSPRAREIDAIYSGLSAAALAAGDDPPKVNLVSNDPRLPNDQVSNQFRLLFDAAKRVGGEEVFLGTTGDFSSPEMRQTLHSAVGSMTDNELADYVRGSPLEGLADALTATDAKGRRRIPETERQELRKMIQDAIVDDIVFFDPLIGEYLDANGEKNTAKNRKKHLDKVNKKTLGKMDAMKKLDELEGAAKGGESDAIAKLKEFLANGIWGRLEEAYSYLESTFDKPPEDSERAALLEAAKKEKDVGVIREKVKKPKGKPKGKPKDTHEPGDVWGKGGEFFAKDPKGNPGGPFKDKGKAQAWASGETSEKLKKARLAEYDLRPWPEFRR